MEIHSINSTSIIYQIGKDWENQSSPSGGDPDRMEQVASQIYEFLGYFVQVLYGLAFLLGVVGNSLVIFVILRYCKMQTVTNLYILNLAIADECFLIGIPFLMTTMALKFWPFGNVMCKVYMTTTSVNQFTSSLLLTVMSADRYIAVCHPVTSTTFRTPLIAKVVSLTAWAVSFLMVVPIFLYASTQQINNHSNSAVNGWMAIDNLSSNFLQGITWKNDTTYIWNNHSYSVLHLKNYTAEEENSNNSLISCNIYWPENEYMDSHTAFTLYTFTLAFAIPLVLILIFYILVIRKLRTVGPNNKSKEKRRTQQRKVTRLVLTVVTVYVLCWLPYWVSQVSLIFTPPKSSQSQFMVTIFLLVGCLGYSNSAVNPILYAFLSDNFKKSFMKACVCAEQHEVNMALGAENSSLFSRRSRSDGSRLAATTRNDPKDNNELRTLASTSANVSCNAICCSTVISQEHLEQTVVANATELDDYQSQYPGLSIISIDPRPSQITSISYDELELIVSNVEMVEINHKYEDIPNMSAQTKSSSTYLQTDL